jgi:hypothetical protein
MGMIERDDNHRYFKDGREIPYVSMILEVTGIKKPCNFIRPHYLERGRIFHEGIDLEIDNGFGQYIHDKAIQPFIDGFHDFAKTTGVQFQPEKKSERKVYMHSPEFCGEYDRSAQFPGHKRPALCEWKSGYKQSWHPYQNGLYCLAKGGHDNVVVWFAKDGTWKWKYYEGLEYLAIEQKCRLILEKFYREFMNADLYGRPAASVPSPLQSPPIDEIPASAGAGSLKE